MTQPTTEHLPPPLVLSKMPETPATAVHPPNGSSKDDPSKILQQFGRSEGTAGMQKLTGCSIFSIITVPATGVVTRCSQVLQEPLNHNLKQFLQQRVFYLRRIRCEPAHSIQSKHPRPRCVRRLLNSVLVGMQFIALGYTPRVINRIPTSTSFLNGLNSIV